MIREDAPIVNALCNHEVLRRMIDELDENYTKQMMKQLRKAENKDASKSSERTKMDVAEVYSPQRMAAMAAKLGFSQGFSLDLTTTNDVGEPWNLSNKKMQDAAIKLQDEQKPWLLVVSPPCTWFSTLMDINITKVDELRVKENMKHSIGHLAFAVLMCLRQAKAGRKFMFEHPAGTPSWATAMMNKLFFVKDGARVDFTRTTAEAVPEVTIIPPARRNRITEEMAAFGRPQTKVRERRVPLRHRSIMTNSPLLAEELKKFQCQIYPADFCKLVCKTVMKEKNQKEFRTIDMLSDSVKEQSIKDVTKEINALTSLEMPTPHQDLYGSFDFVDDITGKPLDHKLAADARKLEIDFFRKM